MEYTDYKKIEKEVLQFKTKYTNGFIGSEITELLEKLNINEKRFNKAMGVNTCIIIDGQIITYHTDIIKGIVCAIEDRGQNILEWD
jgi:hypothetical protein